MRNKGCIAKVLLREKSNSGVSILRGEKMLAMKGNSSKDERVNEARKFCELLLKKSFCSFTIFLRAHCDSPYVQRQFSSVIFGILSLFRTLFVASHYR